MTPTSPRLSPNGRRLIEVLAYPAVQLLDVTGPLQVFASANALAASAGNAEPYEVRVVAKDGPTIEASAGVGLAVHRLPAVSTAVDTLVIPGGDGVNAAAADRVLVDWVRGRARHARRTASVCTGAFLLAEAGLLDGRRATTHWGACARLAARYPKLEVDPDPFFVRDGRVWTSAGVTAGMDLALALVEEDNGRDAALGVARELVLFLKRPGGQAQFSAQLQAQLAERDALRDLQAWMADHPGADLSVEALARRVAMSGRPEFVRDVRGELSASANHFFQPVRHVVEGSS